MGDGTEDEFVIRASHLERLVEVYNDRSINDVRQAYDDRRLRPRIEHGYRFDQEQGLEVEDVRVHTLERMKRLFFLVLAAAQFVFFLSHTWPPSSPFGGSTANSSSRAPPTTRLPLIWC